MADNPTQDDIVKLSIDDFKLWSTMSLKVFLSLRKKSTTGSTETLVARAFAAYEENVPVDAAREHIERVLLNEYQAKLIINGKTLPDPLDMKENWLDEKTGLQFWPQLYLTDITRFYCDVLGKRDIIQRIECEYKQGKAYRYFTNNFMGEVFINNLADDSKYCFLKAKCLPSQRVSAKQYDVWVLLKKDLKDEIGGEIFSAYCTCTAGLMGSCNHVAGLLFRVEAAVLVGITRPVCTSVLAAWNVPSTKKQIIPGPVSSFLFTQDKYTKKSTQLTSNESLSKKHERRLFQPMSPSQVERISNATHVRNELFEVLKDIIPTSCFIENMTGEQSQQSNTFPTIDVPTLIELAESFKDSCNPELDISTLSEVFADSIIITKEQINAVYEQTKLQSESKTWMSQRQGRLTASKFKELTYLSRKLQKDCSQQCPEYIIANVMHYSDRVCTWQMKHGINTEVHAKHMYKSLTKKMHKNMIYSNPGMTIFHEYPYLSASPDMNIECDCHGPGIVEIKCPATLINTVPTVDNYSHLVIENEKVKLKVTSPYYYQIQGQLAATKRSYCDFFVFSFHGNITVRIDLDENFSKDMILNLNWFWRNIIAKELLTTKLKNRMNKLCTEQELIPIKKPAEIIDAVDKDIEMSQALLDMDYLSDINFIVEKS